MRTDRLRRQGSSTKPIAWSRIRPFTGANLGQKTSWAFGSTSSPTTNAIQGNTLRRLEADTAEWLLAVTRDFSRARSRATRSAGAKERPAPAKPLPVGRLVFEFAGPAIIRRLFDSRIVANLILIARQLTLPAMLAGIVLKLDSRPFVLLKRRRNGAWFASQRAQLRLCAYSLQR